MQTINLSLSQLRAALCIAAKQDIRYYLNGVYVECSERVTRVVATDGHALYVHDHRFPKGDDNTFTGSLIIPREVLEIVTKGRATCELAQAIFDDGKWSIWTGACMNPMQFKPIDGVFPDYVRIIPSKRESAEAGQFNPDYIAAFAKVAKIHGSKINGFTIHHNGPTNSALISFWREPNAIGVLMPMRDDIGAPDTSVYRERIYTKAEEKDPQHTATE